MKCTADLDVSLSGKCMNRAGGCFVIEIDEGARRLAASMRPLGTLKKRTLNLRMLVLVIRLVLRSILTLLLSLLMWTLL